MGGPFTAASSSYSRTPRRTTIVFFQFRFFIRQRQTTRPVKQSNSTPRETHGTPVGFRIVIAANGVNCTWCVPRHERVVLGLSYWSSHAQPVEPGHLRIIVFARCCMRSGSSVCSLVYRVRVPDELNICQESSQMWSFRSFSDFASWRRNAHWEPLLSFFGGRGQARKDRQVMPPLACTTSTPMALP